MLEIIYTPAAQKDLKAIGPVSAGKVLQKIEAYAANPMPFSNQVKKLKGSVALRLRVGNYRVIFTEDGIILNILNVGHRREVYRQ